MRLTVSHTFFNKKLDEFGHGHDAELIKMMDLEKSKLMISFPAADVQSAQVNDGQLKVDGNCSMSDMSRQILDQRLSLIKGDVHSELEVEFAAPIMKECVRKLINLECLLPIYFKQV